MIDHQKCIDWLAASKKLKEAKAEEIKLRKEICTELFGTKEGEFTEKQEDKVFSIKGTSKITTSLDQEKLIELAKDELLDQDDVDCFTQVYKMSEAKVKKRPKESNLWKAIEQKPATPTLEITRLEPKGV